MRKLLSIFFFISVVLGMPRPVLAQALQSTSLDNMVAPGEVLPISLRLSNFGGGARVDVSITYLISSATGKVIYQSEETVAVETTQTSIKNVQIPRDAQPGTYTAKISINYAGQVTPATTQFTFRVERKFLGLFFSDFLLYGGGTLGLCVLTVIVRYRLRRGRKSSRYSPIDYTNISRDERVFYELISDTVMGMRQKVGDPALVIASRIPGLTINIETGRVMKISRSPSKIIAELVIGYEKILGKKVSFSFRESELPVIKKEEKVYASETK